MQAGYSCCITHGGVVLVLEHGDDGCHLFGGQGGGFGHDLGHGVLYAGSGHGTLQVGVVVLRVETLSAGQYTTGTLYLPRQGV